MIVKRTIDSNTVRYVEFLEREHDPDQHDLEDAFYVDCGLTYDGSPTSTITGLDHLEGETVKVWAAGDLHDDKRSEERRAGKECGGRVEPGGSRIIKKNKQYRYIQN